MKIVNPVALSRHLSPGNIWGLVGHLTVLCSHVNVHVRFGEWFLADRAHTNVPLTVDFMDGKIQHRDLLFAAEVRGKKGKRYCVTHTLSHAVPPHGHMSCQCLVHSNILVLCLPFHTGTHGALTGLKSLCRKDLDFPLSTSQR